MVTASSPTPPLHTAALTIAGSDSCGGAGIQADLRTFALHGVHGAAAVTALTAQNTLGVHGVEAVRPEFVADQVAAVLADLPVTAAKTGMLPDVATIDAVIAALGAGGFDGPLVVDPVMVATSGDRLAATDTVAAFLRLAGHATLVTPNLDEAAMLTGIAPEDPEAIDTMARTLLEAGAPAVLLKGGHAAVDGDALVIDRLFTAEATHAFESPRRAGEFHGTGCTLAAAITARLALGDDLLTAVGGGLDFTRRAIAHASRPLSGDSLLLGFPDQGRDG